MPPRVPVCLLAGHRLWNLPLVPATARLAWRPTIALVHNVEEISILKYRVRVIDAASPRRAIFADGLERRNNVVLWQVLVQPCLRLAALGLLAASNDDPPERDRGGEEPRHFESKR